MDCYKNSTDKLIIIITSRIKLLIPNSLNISHYFLMTSLIQITTMPKQFIILEVCTLLWEVTGALAA